MKKIKSRSLFTLIPVVILAIGLCIFIIRLIIHGGMWVSSATLTNVRSGGVLIVGTVVDRNGVILADTHEGRRVFAEQGELRRALLHVVGDAAGNIGTGVMTVYATDLIGYNFFSGIYSVSGSGNLVTLTIDSRLNLAAYRALDGRRGAVMVMNFESGEILAMVSNPTFDPAAPPVILDGDPAFEGVFLNRAISSAFTPGSVFKLLTAAIAYENTEQLIERVFYCYGSLQVGAGMVTCLRAHGRMYIEQAMAVSCNVVFGTLAVEVGADTMARYVQQMGLSDSINVGRVRTIRGNFEKADANSAELAWSGVGQFTNTVNPAAMLRFVAAIANGGIAVEMSLTERTGFSSLTSLSSSRIMSTDTADFLYWIMDYNQHSPERLSSFPGLQIHAKTGTAEVGNDMRPHAWFTGFITNPDFPLAFVVIVEHGGGGFAVAAPIANQVLQAAISG